MNWFFIRRQQWSEVSINEYRHAFSTWGGSVVTHPDFIFAMSQVTGIKTKFLALEHEGELAGSIAVWGKYLAGHKKALKKAGCREKIDLGNAEIILPLAEDQQIKLDFRGDFISELNADNILNCKRKTDSLAMLKSYTQGEFSKKFKYNQRREKRLLEDIGGEVRTFDEFSNQQLVDIYRDLFFKRFAKPAKGIDYLNDFWIQLRPYLFGHVLLVDEKPIAIQIIYWVESVKHISVEYINGGVDPDYAEYSPGSVLTYVNTQAAEARAIELNKPLRYSFGQADTGYKSRWCHNVPVYQV